mmetsp:Transcript_20642/g.59810  ORF Transcript_20642/g.59810 Transcript_20642/m.59810 type:complete len:357 (-) Transcript_20642:73-1143(-)
MFGDFNGGELWRSLLISLFGELADKTFIVAVILTAWCPWQGLRSGVAATLERALVFAGILVAFIIRSFLLAYLKSPRFWTGWFDLATAVVFLLLGIRVLQQRRQASEGEAILAKSGPLEDGTTAEDAEQFTWNKVAFARRTTEAVETESPPFDAELHAAAAEPLWNTSAFAGLSLAGSSPDRAGYGTMGPPPRSADGMFSHRMSDDMVSRILAMPLALVLTFLAEADDKSEEALALAGRHGFDVALGAILGFVPSVLLALCVGYLVERQLNQRQAHLLILFAFMAMSLGSLGQCLLSLRILWPAEAATQAGQVMLVRDGIPHAMNATDVLRFKSSTGVEPSIAGSVQAGETGGPDP